MRALGIVLCLTGLLIIAGCGGNTNTGMGGSVDGAWMAVDPATGGDGVTWRTRVLTLEPAGVFALEINAPETRTTGTYAYGGDTLTLTRPELDPPTSDTYRCTLTADRMSLTEGTATTTFARLAETAPSVLAGDWLLARRLAVNGAEIPWTHATRLTIAADGAATLTRQAPTTETLTVEQGAVLAAAGHLGLRIPAAPGHSGALYLLGDGMPAGGVLSLRAPDGTRNIFAGSDALPGTLAATWADQGGDGATLALGADGAFMLTTPSGTEQGVWHAYRGNYLCLQSPTHLRALHWQLANGLLVLGDWQAAGPADPVYTETFWRAQTP